MLRSRQAPSDPQTRKDRRVGLQILGWIGVAPLVLLGVVGIDLSQNFFNWHPEFRMGSVVFGLVYFAGLAGVYGLSRIARARSVIILAALLCGLLALAGLHGLQPEEIDSDAFLVRIEISPLWFRVLLMSLLFLPGIILATHCLSRLGRPPTAPETDTSTPEDHP